jgi:hypothetical protein
MFRPERWQWKLPWLFSSFLSSLQMMGSIVTQAFFSALINDIL